MIGKVDVARPWRRDIQGDLDAITRLVDPILGFSRSENADHYRDKTDIRRIHHTLLAIAASISSSEIECRAKGRRTDKYQRLLDRFDETAETLQQMAVMFKLIH